MSTAANPHRPFTYQWWIHEGGVCEEDGHPDAARAAYAAAVDATDDDYLRGLAAALRDGLPSRR